MIDSKDMKYAAFISYRHTEPDISIAKNLHRKLESFKIPNAIRKKGGSKKIGRIFRDRDELPTSPNLADDIRQALENSEYLIVICSPRTPLSQWVQKEIETFSSLHGHQRILTLLIEGEPHESFPNCLRYIKKEFTRPDGSVSETSEELEPLAADIRNTGVPGMKKKLKIEKLRLLAPMLNCSFDDLRQRNREQFIKKFITVSIAFCLFFLIFGSFSAFQAFQIKKQSELLKEQVQKTLTSQSLYLSDVSTRMMEIGDRRMAIMVAREALPKNFANPERPYMEEGEYALSRALMVYNTENCFVPDLVLKHKSNIIKALASPDNQRVITLATDYYLYVWDAEHGELIDKLYLDGAVLSMTDIYFRDANSIIVCSNNDIYCFDINNSFEVLWHYTGYFDTALSPDKNKLAIAGKSITVLDTINGEELFCFSPSNNDLDSLGYNYFPFVSFDNESETLFAGTDQGHIFVFNLDSKNLVSILKAVHYNIEAVAQSDAGLIAVSSRGHEGNTLEIFDLKNMETLYNINSHTTVNLLHFMPDGNDLLYCNETTINHLDIGNRKVKSTFTGEDKITGCVFVGKHILLSTNYGTIYTLEANNLAEVPDHRILLDGAIAGLDGGLDILVATMDYSVNVNILRHITNLGMVLPTIRPYCDAYYSSDGKKLLALEKSYRGTPDVWDMESKSFIGTLQNEVILFNIGFVNNDRFILLVNEDGVILYDADSLNVVRYKAWDYPPYYSFFNADKSLLCILKDDGYIILNTSDLSIAVQATIDKEIVSSISQYSKSILFFHDNRRILLITINKAFVFDIATGNLIYELPDDLINVAISPDGEKMACVYKTGAIDIVDVNTFDVVNIIPLGGVPARTALFDSTGDTLFVELVNYVIRRYSVNTGSLIMELEGFPGTLRTILFSRDNTRFITAWNFGKAVLWNNETNKKVADLNNFSTADPLLENLLFIYDDKVIIIPAYDVGMLFSEAERQLNGRELTYEEKQKLFLIE